MHKSLLSVLAALAATSVAHAQFLLTAESATDKVILLDAFNGSVLNAAYIDMVPAGSGTPIEPLVVGNEIWVSDQSGKVMRFTLDGTTWIANITTGLSNTRGMELVGSEVWVANDASGGDAIHRFDMAGASLGTFPSANPWDVTLYQGDVLINDISAYELRRYSTAGVFLSMFHDSDGLSGIDFPEQMWPRANDHVYAAGFITPTGIYEYDASGAQVNYWAVSSTPRGVAELGNGLIIYSETNAIRTYDPVNMVTAPILTGVTARHFGKFAGPNPGTAFCFGDGTGTACPCSPVPVPHGAPGKGCPTNVFANGALAKASGNPSIAADTLVLTGTDMINGSMIFYQGPTQQSAGAGAVFGDGLRCIQPTSIRRFKTKTIVGNTASYPVGADPKISVAGNVLAPGVRHYQGWYRSANPTFCTVDTFNLTNGVSITWVP